MSEDWTRDPVTNRSNSSAEFRRLAGEVGALIRESAHDLLAGRTNDVGGLIMAQLAHKHGLRPSPLGGLETTDLNLVSPDQWRGATPDQREAFWARESARPDFAGCPRCLNCGYPTHRGVASCEACR